MDQKDEIKQKIDIVDLIQEYVPLKQAGSVSWKGLCPFHSEKTPSFHVSRDKQIWHCFGCSEGGDCFAFVMKLEGMDFPEALRHLGAKVGIEVIRFSSTESNDKQRLVAANTFAAHVYRDILMQATYAAHARAYVEKRGIPEALAEAFGLGFAPDAWDTLARACAKKGPDMDGERAGLLMRRKQGSGFIDRFRNRIMIPLRDAQGNVIGFTGRIFMPGTEDQGPKYMNSPETAVYHKGSILFGLDMAKKGIREKGSVVIVEGQMDVIASHKAGVTNIVASSGTALTEIQLQLLKRYTNTIVFSFDADAAGFKAAQRGITLARAAGFDVRVAVLPVFAGKDPDEAVQKNPELWRTAVEKTVPIMQYYIDRALAGKDLHNVDDKRAVSSFLLPELAQTTDMVEREHWLQVIADLLRTDLSVLRQAAAKNGSASVPGIGGISLRSMSPNSDRSKKMPRMPEAVAPAKSSRLAKSLDLLVGLFINQAEFRPSILAALSSAAFSKDTHIAALYKLAVSLYDQQGSSLSAQPPLFRQLRDQLQTLPDIERDPLIALLDTIVLEAERLVTDQVSVVAQGHVRQLIEAVSSSEVRRLRKEFERDLRRAEQAGNKEEVQRLLELYRKLGKQ